MDNESVNELGICNDSLLASCSSGEESCEEDHVDITKMKVRWDKVIEKPEKTNMLEDIAEGFMQPEYETLDTLKNLPSHINSDSKPIDFFNLFFPEDFVQLLVDQTNLYAEQTIIELANKKQIKPFSRLFAWKKVDKGDIKLYIGMVLWMGLISNRDMEGKIFLFNFFFTNYIIRFSLIKLINLLFINRQLG